MGTDDDIIRGGGPLSKVVKWLWNYDLMIFGASFRSLYFVVGVIVAAWAAGKWA